MHEFDYNCNMMWDVKGENYMNKRRKLRNRVLSYTMCMTLVLSGLMVPAKQVQAETAKTIAGLGTSMIAAPVAPTSVDDPWTGSYVYYGSWDGDGDGTAEPTKYRVLDTSTTLYSEDGTTQTMFLDCDSVLYTQCFHTDVNGTRSDWAGSGIKASLNGDDFLNKDGVFTAVEKNAIAASKVAGHALTSDIVGEFFVGAIGNYIGLNGEKIFLLDFEDVCNESYGYMENSADYYVYRQKESNGADTAIWWLRTTIAANANSATYVREDGYMFFEGHGEIPSASPAFNVNLSSVLFSSVVSGTAGETGAEYKLTLLDDGMTVTPGILKKKGSKVTIPYSISGTNSANATQVSVLILDDEYTVGNTNGANVLVYDKLNVDTFSASGTGTFTMPDSLYGMEAGYDYYVYIIAEDVNGAKETDYASTPVAITIPENVPVVGEDGFEYIVYDDDTVEVTGYKGTDKDLVIPSEIEGLPVTSIGEEAFSYCDELTSITIPNTVINIGDGAFMGCTSLTSMTIPKGVTEIGKGVLSGCEGLTSVSIPEGVEHIGESAFDYCSSLETLTLPKSLKSIDDLAFFGCATLKSITIPEGVERIGEAAFQSCSSLESVILPKSLTELGEWAFLECSKLQSVTIPEGVECVGEMTFAGCSNLQSIIIPEGVTSIGESAFYGCAELKNVTIPDGVTSIGEGAFEECSSLETVEIPSTVTDIGTDAFASCPDDMVVYVEEGSAAEEYMQSVGINTDKIPVKELAQATGSVITTFTYDGTKKTLKGTDMNIRYQSDILNENVDYQIAEYKNNLYAGTASVTLKGIGKYSGQLVLEFEIAKAEKPAIMPAESISASYSCQTVGVCDLPTGWKWDEKDAAKALEIGVPLKATACYVASDKDSYNQTSVMITITRSKCEHVWDSGTVTKPATTESTGEMLYTCQVCKETKVEAVDKLLPPKKGDKYQDKDATANYIITKINANVVEVAYAGMIKSTKSVKIPNEVVLADGTKAKVTSISKNAFKGKKSIKTVTIGKNIVTIGDNAFYKCTALTKISIPSKVKTIGKQAFYGCKKMKSVTIGKNVNKIGSKAFYGCGKLKTLTVKSTKLTAKKMGSKAFAKTPKNMTVKIPKKKFKPYKSMFVKYGVNKKAKFKKN